MKTLIITLVICVGLIIVVSFTGRQRKPGYTLQSICKEYHDTTATSVSPYNEPVKVGDTVLVWHCDTVGSNYVIKEIK